MSYGTPKTAASLYYQHVIDGKDAEIVAYLDRSGDDPSVLSRADHDY